MSLPKTNLLYGKTIGIIGGGQLGRMMATTARHMGYQIIVLDPTPNAPAGQIADQQIIADYDDFEAIKQLADEADVVTYEFENVDLETARYLEEKNLLPQGTKALKITQDRQLEKERIKQLELPHAPFKLITDKTDFNQAVETIGFPAVVKTCRGGYDGKGQVILHEQADLARAKKMLTDNQPLIYEKFIAFDCEISVIFTRSQTGAITYFPVAENNHRDHILHTTIAPARVPEHVEREAKRATEKLAQELEVVGTFAIEFFVKDHSIYINELAPRPHNSGHFTIEACNVSQFEQHIRAICNLPLMPIHFHGGAVMINLLGDNLDYFLSKIDRLEIAHVHMYGKDEIREKRKVGHLTFVDHDRDKLLAELEKRQFI